MRVFKGFNKDMTCTCGHGTYQYEIGKHYTTEASKTRNTGFHSSEYVLECLSWYPLGKGRVCVCEAGGDINEDGEDIVSSTEITVMLELSLPEIAYEAALYMVRYQSRRWKRSGNLLSVKSDTAEVRGAGIAIARGENPKVKVGEGGYGVLLKEEDGKITNMRLLMARAGRGKEPDTWYTLNEAGEVVKCNE